MKTRKGRAKRPNGTKHANDSTSRRREQSKAKRNTAKPTAPPAFIDTQPPEYLRHLPANARTEFARATTLSALLSSVEPLTPDERVLIVRQALILIEQNYAHLPLKRAMHAVDPVQRLKLLLQELESSPAGFESDLAFHSELTDIFTSLRDLHTNYLLPEPYAGMTAFLPFMVEECFVPQHAPNKELRRTFLVSHIFEGFKHESFTEGAEILYWNGMPIERAVRNNAQRFAGSNTEARHARGIQTLTTRVLRMAAPPDEEWVIVGYRTLAGLDKEIRFDWVVNPIQSMSDPTPEAASRAFAASVGVDMHQELVQEVRTSLFGRYAIRASADARNKVAHGGSLEKLESEIPAVLQAKRVVTRHGTFGYVRIRTFSVDPVTLVNEFVRLVSALPRQGLIIDVRGNGGGIIHSGEFLLQLLTPRRIEPEPVQFINTPLNLQICAGHGSASPFADLTDWTDSMQQALRTGATFSAGFPISTPEQCNAIGQRYFGPVVLITDALCYSTTDIFAAGFQDHDIGKIIGTNRNTGAGGANVWQHGHLVEFVMPGGDSVYRPLPRGAGMRVSMRRTLRVGRRAGTPVEDLGVVPDFHHLLTRDDVLKDNVDLKDRAGEILSSLPVRDMAVRALGMSGRAAKLRLTVRGMNRVDVYVGDRPVNSIEQAGKVFDIDVEARAPETDVVELRGFDGDELVGRYRVTWREIAERAPTPAKGRKPAKAAVAKGRRARPIEGQGTATPNAGDDEHAVAEVSPTSFGGPALVGDAAAVGTPRWRAAESLLELRRQVNALAPARNKASDGLVGDAAHAARTSDHNPWVRDGDMGIVTACDITHDPAGGCDAGRIAESLRAGRDARIKYIIWNRRIANSEPIGEQPAWAWRPYSGANPHTKHVHISVKADKAHYDSGQTWPI